MRKLVLGRLLVTGLMVLFLWAFVYYNDYLTMSEVARTRKEAEQAAKIMLQIVQQRFQEPPYDKLLKGK
jgi:hypothetical protein